MMLGLGYWMDGQELALDFLLDDDVIFTMDLHGMGFTRETAPKMEDVMEAYEASMDLACEFAEQEIYICDWMKPLEDYFDTIAPNGLEG